MKPILDILTGHKDELHTLANELQGASPSGAETIATKIKAAAALVVADVGALFDGLTKEAKGALEFVEEELHLKAVTAAQTQTDVAATSDTAPAALTSSEEAKLDDDLSTVLEPNALVTELPHVDAAQTPAAESPLGGASPASSGPTAS